MSSFELNKIMGSILAITLFVLVINNITDLLFEDKKTEKLLENNIIAKEDNQGSILDANQPKEEFKNIEERLVLADIEKGRKFTKKCIACHSFENDDKNKIGPNLFSIFNRKIASIESFTYSKILENMDNEWDAFNLDGFLTDPKKWAPGTKMIFVGIKDSQDRANVIKYMQTLK